MTILWYFMGLVPWSDFPVELRLQHFRCLSLKLSNFDNVGVRSSLKMPFPRRIELLATEYTEVRHRYLIWFGKLYFNFRMHKWCQDAVIAICIDFPSGIVNIFPHPTSQGWDFLEVFTPFNIYLEQSDCPVVSLGPPSKLIMDSIQLFVRLLRL